MTRIVDVLNRVARQTSIAAPSSWITATADEHVELREDFLRQSVCDAMDRIDWPSPVSDEAVITGTGVETYALPSTFKRIHRDDMAVHDETLTRYSCPVHLDSQWSLLRFNGLTGADRVYRITGFDGNYEISFLPLLSTDVTVHYVTTYWMAASGVPGVTFSDDEDVLLLPDKMIETGIVWRWRERRGLPFEGKMDEYDMLMQRYSNASTGLRKVDMGQHKKLRWQDNIPAFIPPA